MIFDASTVETGHCMQADLCIVGAGAAGIALALQFEHRSERVLLLEAGDARPDKAAQAFFRGVVADPRAHPPLDTYRRRVFGGATDIWGGRCVPFDPIDFAARPWMPGSPWPVAYPEVAAYYERASGLCEVGEVAFTAGAAFPHGLPPTLEGFDGRYFTDSFLERFSCPTRFAKRYGTRLRSAPNITVLLRANVTEICTTDDGARVARLRVACAAGRRFSAQAKNYVLAMGGLEIPRLLLASRDHHTQGLGNARDQVGRCYMTHLAGTIGQVVPSIYRKKPFHGYQKSDDGVFCRGRFAMRAEAQRHLRVGNFIARLHHPSLRNPAHRTGALSAVFLARPFIGFEYAFRLSGGPRLRAADWLAHLRNVAADPAGVASFGLHWLRDRVLATRKFPSLIVRPRSGPYSLDFHAEQAPNPQSRVTLGHDRDAHGLPRLHVDWRPSAIDRRTLRVALHALAADFALSGCARLNYDPAELEFCGAYGGHHIGTARMSATPREGVVNSDCRVHGVRNLFIAGSAVFPTSSQANPTLTLVALAVRLGDFLKLGT